MEKEPTQLNIYQKLINVRKTVPYLKKDNKGYQFKYVSSSQTLGAVRDAMDENALLLIPRVVGYDVSDHTTSKGGHEYFTQLKMSFTWVNADNPEEQIECPWTGQGLDNGEKGVGKALTYAEKFFLLKFFNIATDKDDPDAHQKPKGIPPKTTATPPQGNAEPFLQPTPTIDPVDQAKSFIAIIGDAPGMEELKEYFASHWPEIQKLPAELKNQVMNAKNKRKGELEKEMP